MKTVYITKWAFSKGIQEITVEEEELNDRYRIKLYIDYLCRNVDYFLTKEEAIRDVISKIEKKKKSLEKQIVKLKSQYNKFEQYLELPKEQLENIEFELYKR